eukprot:38365-Rhodomonas_salina.1
MIKPHRRTQSEVTVTVGHRVSCAAGASGPGVECPSRRIYAPWHCRVTDSAGLRPESTDVQRRRSRLVQHQLNRGPGIMIFNQSPAAPGPSVQVRVTVTAPARGLRLRVVGRQRLRIQPRRNCTSSW